MKKEKLINEFYETKGQFTEQFIKNVNSLYTINKQDPEISLLHTLVNAYTAEKTLQDIPEAYERAKPIFEKLANKDLTDYEVTILVLAIGYCKSYTRTIEWIQKLSVLVKNNPEKDSLTLTLYMLSSLRLLRAKYYNFSTDAEDIKKWFNHCVDKAKAQAIQLEMPGALALLALRQGIFDQKAEQVEDNLKILKEMKITHLHSSAKDDLVECMGNLGGVLTTSLCNVAIGWQIRKIRKELELSSGTVAKYLDIAPSHMSRIESGVTGVTLRGLFKFAKELDIDISYFVGVQNRKPMPPPTQERNSTRRQIVKMIDDMSDKEAEKHLKLLKLLEE